MAQKRTTVSVADKKTSLQSSVEEQTKNLGKSASSKQANTKISVPGTKNATVPVSVMTPSATNTKGIDAQTSPSQQPQLTQKEGQKKQVTPPTCATLEPNGQPTVIKSKITFGGCFPDSDVYLFSGPMFEPAANRWSKMIRDTRNQDHHHAVIFFCSLGGSADEAFRMMRLLQNFYQNIDVVVFGKCYSAATLFALGANRILMSEDAQLGPLDVQISKEDDNSRMSGECYRQALITLSGMSSESLKSLFVRLKNEMGFPVSTGTASRIASEIVVGLFAPITQQIEPAKLGDVMRAQGIAHSYGLRLMNNRYSPHVANNIATRLAYGYPSHTTVIDFDEAKLIGLHVEKISVETFCNGMLKSFSEKMLTPMQDIVMNSITEEAL